MDVRTSPWPTGVPCWPDLSSTDVEPAKRFYAAVLGWAFERAGDADAGYEIATVDGAAAAGISLAPPRRPSAWTVYFATAGAGAAADAVTALGGTVLLPATELPGLAVVAIASDPTGATFGLWEAQGMIGAAVVNRHGGLTWEDLRSTDPVAAQDFYRDLFGVRMDPLPDAGTGYATFSRPDEPSPLGGIGGIGGASDGPESHWLLYFGVDDVDAAVRAAEATGGTVAAPAFDSPFGRMAGLRDPGGARFQLIENGATPQPDRSG